MCFFMKTFDFFKNSKFLIFKVETKLIFLPPNRSRLFGLGFSKSLNWTFEPGHRARVLKSQNSDPGPNISKLGIGPGPDFSGPGFGLGP